MPTSPSPHIIFLALCTLTLIISATPTHTPQPLNSSAHASCSGAIYETPCPCKHPSKQGHSGLVFTGTVDGFETIDGTTWITIHSEEATQRTTIHAPRSFDYPCNLEPPAIALGDQVLGFFQGIAHETWRDLCLEDCQNTPQCSEDCSTRFIATNIIATENASIILYPISNNEVFFGRDDQDTEFTQNLNTNTVIWNNSRACSEAFLPPEAFEPPPCNDVIDTSTCTIHPSSPNSPTPLQPLAFALLTLIATAHRRSA